ncbi:formimidoylglutamase [Bacillus shivajii]|uniref:formimidoylglutamase n=1 Tax=Bacillus shivajii TaxID=1983719 RepID=UPI001CF9B04F|nr:formimidoylglutamase [Bacillus shivajii]UCZ54025.1 formimidoylglutamase [Bacillus shivajii]
MNKEYKGLTAPPFTWTKTSETPEKVHEWIKPIQDVSSSEIDDADVVMIGIPLSRSSISASAASEFPDAFRKSWKGFATYNLDDDVDLSTLSVIDLGDTKQHVTNIDLCHENITTAVTDIQSCHSKPLQISIGGDHSITAMTVKGIRNAHPDKKVGIIQLDTHFDLRDPNELGPANGTPIRYLIENELIEGDHVYNIGLHGFFNTKALKEYADKHGVHYTTMRAARKKGLNTVIEEALNELSVKVDVIYFTCDMDVLDMSYAPGVPATTPGGMRTDEIFEAATLIGTHPQVRAMDIVCLDPKKDMADMTVKAGTHVFLSFLSGVALRK